MATKLIALMPCPCGGRAVCPVCHGQMFISPQLGWKSRPSAPEDTK